MRQVSSASIIMLTRSKAQSKKRRHAEASSIPVRRALVVVDLVESVRLMQRYEADIIQRWRQFVKEVASHLLPLHKGRLVKSLGDGLMMEFKEVRSAVAAALEIQERMASYNVGRPDDAAMYLRVGANVADVVVDKLDVYGAGVNVAARLAALAGPGEVVISAEVRDELTADVDATLSDMGECYVKHVDRPLRAFRVARPGKMLVPPAALPKQRPMVPRIAVFALQDRSDEARLLRVGDSLCDDLTARMSRCAYWQITSRLSTMSLSQRELDLRALGELLQVDFVVTGSVHIQGRQGQVNLQLTEVRTGAVVWADVLQSDVETFVVGDASVASRANALMMRALLRREMSFTHDAAMPNLPSYALLLQAVSLMHSLTDAHFGRAYETLTHLEERHPRSPDVLAWKANWHVFRVLQKWSQQPLKDIDLAQRFLQKALDIDAHHALARTLVGHLAAAIEHDADKAEENLRLALNSNPNEPLAWLILSRVLACQDRAQDGVTALEQARALSPLDPMAYFYDAYAATVYGAAGQYEVALHHARRSAVANPNHLPSLAVLIIALHDSGLVSEASAAANRYLQLRPTASVAAFLDSHMAAGRPVAKREANALLRAGIPL